MTKIWRIEGNDGLNQIFCGTASGALSDREVQELLRRLVCRHLSADEIVGASLRKGMCGRRYDLDVTAMSGKRHGWMTNGDPHYVAYIADHGG